MVVDNSNGNSSNIVIVDKAAEMDDCGIGTLGYSKEVGCVQRNQQLLSGVFC